MLELMSTPFMIRALIAALCTGLLAPTIGIFIVQRRMSMLGDGLAHLALAGAGFAMMTGVAPLPVVVVTCIIGALLIEWVRVNTSTSGDLVLAVLLYGGLSSGVLMASMAGPGATGLFNFLFGSLLGVTNGDVILVVIMSVATLSLVLFYRKSLFAVHADPEFAKTQGVNVSLHNIIVIIGAALTVAISLRTVGILLVAALMVIPVGIAQNSVTGFYRIQLLSLGVGALCVTVGIALSLFFDTPPGATIVLLCVFLYIASAFFKVFSTKSY